MPAPTRPIWIRKGLHYHLMQQRQAIAEVYPIEAGQTVRPDTLYGYRTTKSTDVHYARKADTAKRCAELLALGDTVKPFWLPSDRGDRYQLLAPKGRQFTATIHLTLGGWKGCLSGLIGQHAPNSWTYGPFRNRTAACRHMERLYQAAREGKAPLAEDADPETIWF